jgi:hypothetical protein
MIVIDRMIQKIYSDKWAELEVIDKKYNAAEARLGFPPKKRYSLLTGGYATNTLIVERQWPSLAAMEATHEKAMADPEYQALGMEITSIVKSVHWELYMPLP